MKADEKANSTFWESPRRIAHKIWLKVAKIWHGYEIHGLENIPTDGPALLLFFHGAIPADGYFVQSKIFMSSGRQSHFVVDNFLFKFPWYKSYSECMLTFPGTVDSCVDILKEGNLLMIAPGGTYEGQFGDKTYKMLWRNRLGFAKVALQAGVDIIPFFSTNIQEAYRPVGIFEKFWEKIYLKTRLPIAPLFGGFPVKIQTYVGNPIKLSKDMSPEKVKEIVLEELGNLIKVNQRIPGNILNALLERF